VTLKVPGPLPYPPRTSPLGDCSDAARRRESADGIERGRRVLLEERFENTEGYGRETVARRGRAARQTALENVNPRAGRPAGTRAR
jgi:hypothetical protein